MEDFRKKTGRISVCLVLSILKAVPVSQEIYSDRLNFFSSSENSFPKSEDLHFESLGISEQTPNAPGQFH